MKNISIIAGVYNEERRIEYMLQSFAWSDDIVLIDKSSQDRTVEIARKYTNNIISIPYQDGTGEELQRAVALATNEWVLFVTASDVIHPKLVEKVLDLINREDFDYDVIALPFALYVLGIRDPKRSPWCMVNKDILVRKSALVTSDKVHTEISYDSTKIYRMSPSEDVAFYHLTHETLEMFWERHTRYTRLEAGYYTDGNMALKASFKELLRALYVVVVKKKSFLRGWDGVALGLAYVSYFIMKFLYVWERFRGKGPAEYDRIRRAIVPSHRA